VSLPPPRKTAVPPVPVIDPLLVTVVAPPESTTPPNPATVPLTVMVVVPVPTLKTKMPKPISPLWCR
jgi:hypothetical protein